MPISLLTWTLLSKISPSPKGSFVINLTDTELNQLYRFAYSLCDDQATAWDLLQSALTKALATGNTSPSKKLLRTVIKNLYIDEYRRHNRFTHIEFSETSTEQETISLVTPGFEDLIISEKEFENIWTNLSIAERELLFSHIIEGNTAQEIATTMGTSRGTVLSRIHRLKKRIRNIVKTKNPIESGNAIDQTIGEAQ